MAPHLLGPYLSGLLTGDEINGALSQFSRPTSVTIVADSPRADLYVEALSRRGIATTVKAPQAALLAGLPQSCPTVPVLEASPAPAILAGTVRTGDADRKDVARSQEAPIRQSFPISTFGRVHVSQAAEPALAEHLSTTSRFPS